MANEDNVGRINLHEWNAYKVVFKSSYYMVRSEVVFILINALEETLRFGITNIDEKPMCASCHSAKLNIRILFKLSAYINILTRNTLIY